MDQLVFTNKEYSSFFNNKFVAIKLLRDEGEGKELRKRFAVPGNPTIILVDASGEEIDRIVGFGGDGNAFVNKVKEYAAGKGVLSELLKQYRADSLNVHNNFKLAEKHRKRYESKEAEKYYRNVVQLDPKNENGYGEKSTFHIALYEMWNTSESAQLEKVLQTTKNEEMLSNGYSNLIRFYSNKKDSVNLYKAYERAVVSLPQDAGIMNQYAWAIYEDKNQALYARGIELAQKAVEIKPDDAAIWDTLAWLLYEAGDKQGAVEAMTKAADLDPNFKDALKEISE